MSYDLILRNGDIIDPGENQRFVGDIGISDGRIAAITAGTLTGTGTQEIDVAGQIVTPGLVDLHGHCYWGVGGTGLDPDLVGARHGVTTWIDPGSSGAATFPGFKRFIIDQAQVRVIPLLNLSAKGLVHCQEVGELNNMIYVDTELNAATLEMHRGLIAGIKIRAGRSSTGQTGMTPLWIGRELCDQYSIPLMVHISMPAPTLQELLPMLRTGDIVTHCFHGKPGGILMRGQVRDEAWAARERGVLFDVGHGNSSFLLSRHRRGAGARLSTRFHQHGLASEKHPNLGEELSLCYVQVSRAWYGHGNCRAPKHAHSRASRQSRPPLR